MIVYREGDARGVFCELNKSTNILHLPQVWGRVIINPTLIRFKDSRRIISWKPPTNQWYMNNAWISHFDAAGTNIGVSQNIWWRHDN